ncbi:2871_t:CDS:2, partial [Racocetra fulgida]
TNKKDQDIIEDDQDVALTLTPDHVYKPNLGLLAYTSMDIESDEQVEPGPLAYTLVDFKFDEQVEPGPLAYTSMDIESDEQVEPSELTSELISSNWDDLDYKAKMPNREI